MGRIQSSIGLITGVPIEDTVNQLMQLSALPRNRLAARNETLGREQAALTTLTTLVIGVQLTTDRLGQAALFSSSKVTSSKPDLLAVRSTGSPALGSYSFVPVRQAQSQQLTSGLFSSAQHKLVDGQITIHTGGFLDQSVQLDQFHGGSGVSRGFIRITDRSGASRDVDLRFALTANDVVSAINATEGISVVARLEGSSFVLSDISGATTHQLSVQEVGSGNTARDLGLAGISVAANSATGADVYSLQSSMGLRHLRDGRGLDLPAQGTALRFSLRDGSQINWSNTLTNRDATVGQLLAEINAAGNGKLTARISSDGRGLEIEDLTAGAHAFSISSPVGSLASQLGLTGPAPAGLVSGSRLLSGLGDTLLSSLNGGSGLGTLGEITITDRAGQSDTIDLSAAQTLQQVLSTINSGAQNGSFRAQLNRTKTGIEIVDTSGGSGPLQVANAGSTQSATALGIAGSFASQTIDSGSLNRQFVGRNTAVQDFLAGQSLSPTTFRLTDSSGATATFNAGTRNPQSLGDVIDGINGLGIGIEARVNAAGDGLLLIDTAGGQGTMSVADLGGGTAAAQLRIAGSAQTIQLNDAAVAGIDGSKTLRITTTTATSLADLVTQINQHGGSPVRASLLNLGTSGVRLQLNGNSSGAQSRVMISSTAGMEFAQTSEARDALISFGANELGGGVLVSSSTNRFTGLVDDLEITINGTSTTPVTIDVAENGSGIALQIETFVEQYNKLRDQYDELTVFDANTNQVGLLFGSSIAIRMEQGYSRLFTAIVRRSGTGAIQSLPELGVRLNERGQMTFDRQQFERALTNNPQAVKEFFTDPVDGFATRAKAMADSLAGVENGSLLARNNALQQNIEQNAARIEAMDLRLERERDRLLRQFYAMEQAIARMQRQMTSINQLQPLAPMSRSG